MSLMISSGRFAGMNFDPNRLQSLPDGIRNWPGRFRGNCNLFFLTCHNVALGSEVIYLSAKEYPPLRSFEIASKYIVKKLKKHIDLDNRPVL